MPTPERAKNPKLAALLQEQAAMEAENTAEQAKQKTLTRKEDTRLKMMEGPAMNAELDPETGSGIGEVLKKAVTAPRDRESLASKGWL